MVTDKQKANLRRGNPGKRNKSKGNQNAVGKTWQTLIIEYGETASTIDPKKTWKQVIVESAYRHAALGNAAILKELFQRSEPQDEKLTGELVIKIVRGNALSAEPTPGASNNPK
jgi:hypothetical protein